ncbi:MAG: hypothetical protein LBC98_02855 [Prevotellaceae bacterium]|jgi:hypothetical protein|nr:hypothetical protein [Prevotellaceae bacterium]
MIKRLQLLLALVAVSGLFSSCLKKGTYQMPGETYVVSTYSMSGGYYFTGDDGSTVLPKNAQEVNSWQIESGKRLFMIFNQDQDSWNAATNTWTVEVVGLYEVPEVEILPIPFDPAADTVGTDPLYHDESYFMTWVANGFITTRFAYQHSGSNTGAAKHTFGLASDPAYGDYAGGDTVRLLLWHNAHGDAMNTMGISHNCVNIRSSYYPWIPRDSVTIAIKYKTDATTSRTMYTKYKSSY